MGSIVRGVVVYLFLLVLFRIAGKRTMNEITAFDFVLLLIISEAVQQALINNDDSLTNALLVVLIRQDAAIARRHAAERGDDADLARGDDGQVFLASVV